MINERRANTAAWLACYKDSQLKVPVGSPEFPKSLLITGSVLGIPGNLYIGNLIKVAM
jgi:hypothetical protein